MDHWSISFRYSSLCNLTFDRGRHASKVTEEEEDEEFFKEEEEDGLFGAGTTRLMAQPSCITLSLLCVYVCARKCTYVHIYRCTVSYLFLFPPSSLCCYTSSLVYCSWMCMLYFFLNLSAVLVVYT